MKLYACYTPSHKHLVERHFSPSIPSEFKSFKGRFILRELPQVSKTGAFASKGFQSTCADKVRFILEALKKEREPFVFSDVDVRFYGPVAKDLLRQLGKLDMVFQYDGAGETCSGFFVVRPCARTRAFFADVLAIMEKTGKLDQDALRERIHQAANRAEPKRWGYLSENYWTVGRDWPATKDWKPGDAIPTPPDGLLVHHANWTKGVDNKLALLEQVQAAKIKAPTMIERHPLGATAAARQLVEQAVAKVKTWHHPMPMALVLQFWQGDRKRALDLARLLTDIESEPREDVLFVFARQSVCPKDREITEAMLYAGQRFLVTELETKVDERKRYPGICYDPWASAVQQLSDAYYTGRLPYHSAFYFEADGYPLARDWIDQLKDAHQATLDQGKLVTGPRMRWDPHINGTLVMHARCWEDHPSLHRCPSAQPWDIFHGHALLSEAGTHPKMNIITNMYGMENMSDQVWHTLGINSAWGTSCKDGLGQYWARKNLAEGNDTHRWHARTP